MRVRMPNQPTSRIHPAHPHHTIRPRLTLPNRHAVLHRLDEHPTRLKTLRAMRGARSADNRKLAHVQQSNPMMNRAACAGNLRFNMLRNALKLLLRHRLIGCVLKRRDRPALRVVAHDTKKDIDRAGFRMRHRCNDFLGAERFMREQSSHEGDLSYRSRIRKWMCAMHPRCVHDILTAR